MFVFPCRIIIFANCDWSFKSSSPSPIMFTGKEFKCYMLHLQSLLTVYAEVKIPDWCNYEINSVINFEALIFSTCDFDAIQYRIYKADFWLKTGDILDTAYVRQPTLNSSPNRMNLDNKIYNTQSWYTVI